MSFTENINDGTSLDACKGPTALEVGGNLAAEISPASNNSYIEANNYCAT